MWRPRYSDGHLGDRHRCRDDYGQLIFLYTSFASLSKVHTLSFSIQKLRVFVEAKHIICTHSEKKKLKGRSSSMCREGRSTSPTKYKFAIDQTSHSVESKQNTFLSYLSELSRWYSYICHTSETHLKWYYLLECRSQAMGYLFSMKSYRFELIHNNVIAKPLAIGQ